MSSPSPSPLARLWAHAQEALTALCASLMPLDTLSGGERRTLRGWLGALEAFCRRLALSEAMALAHAAQPARSPAVQKTSSLQRTAHRLRRPSLRLWPKLKRPRARVRLLGAATSVREIEDARRRDALIARLKAGRGGRRPAHLKIADRIEALQRFLDAPTAAVRRFARRLRDAPSLATIIVARRVRPCPFLSPERVSECNAHPFGVVQADTS